MIAKLFLLSEVAEQTGLSERALADAARAHKLPAQKIHRRWYMTEDQIESYVRSHRPDPVKPKGELTEDEAWAKFEANRKRRRNRTTRKSDT